MFLDEKTVLEIWLNPWLNLTIFRGTGPSTSVSREKSVVLLGNLTLATEPVPFPSPLPAVLISDREEISNITGILAMGIRQRQTSSIMEQNNLRYSLNATGNYSLHVTCVNRLSQAKVSTIVIVPAPILGLAIERMTPQETAWKVICTA